MELNTELKNIIEKHGRSPENLIQILLEYQADKDAGFISEDEIKLIASELNISESRVCGVMSFYSLLSTKPRGRFVIQVCNDVPCYVNGSLNVLRELEGSLKIKIGETTPDGIFSLEYTSCLGCCDISPAIRIEEELYGNLTSEKISEIISLYRRKYNGFKK
jgi:NADH-quinone oxidoreductase subunit E